MESQNKLFEAFRAAAEADEQTAFPAQDRLWERIAAQLDEQPKKQVRFSFWKISYLVAAFALLLGLGIGLAYFLTSKQIIAPSQNVSIATEQSPFSQKQYVESAHLKNTESKTVVAHSQPKEKHANVGAASVPVFKGDTILENNRGTELELIYRNSHLPSLVKVDPVGREQSINFGENDAISKEGQSLIMGVVLNKANQPLTDAVVQVRGTDIFTKTDAKGNFAFNVPNDKIFLTVSAIGNETKTIHMGDDSFYLVSLSPDRSNLAIYNDILKSGSDPKSRTVIESIAQYGGTSGVSKLTSEGYLKGYGPGLVASERNAGRALMTNQKAGAQKGLTAGDYLIVVDGEVYKGNLNDINKSDIKEIKILSDTKAALLYGILGKNGVIQITLKKPVLKKAPRAKKRRR